jgi:hypothetical protein
MRENFLRYRLVFTDMLNICRLQDATYAESETYVNSREGRVGESLAGQSF